MAKKYKKKYRRLEERYDILNEHMLDITDDNERYLKTYFIKQKYRPASRYLSPQTIDTCRPV